MNGSNKLSFIILLLFCAFVVVNGVNAAGSAFTRDLTVGTRGDDVTALQQFLIGRGFLKILVPTGYFGPVTKTALGAWQASAGISPSVGFFGSISRAKINISVQPTSIYIAPTQNFITTSSQSIATTSAIASSSGDGSPVRLKIPELNIDAGFQYDGLNTNGTMQIPSNIYDVGWYTYSPRPGEKGSSIITGHVAQIRRGVLTKPGVFIALNELRPGDKLSVLNNKGETITFVVRESRLYDPSADATDVFAAKDNGAHLNLITCDGTWNQAQLSYSQRLVVFTDAVQ